MLRTLPIIIFFLSVNLKAFDNRMLKLDVDDGLVSNRVLDILRDKSDRIWITTIGGVSCYDGYRITNYSPKATKSNYIEGVRFRTILESSDKRVWVGADSGLFFYSEKLNAFKQFPLTGKGSPSISKLILKNDSILYVSGHFSDDYELNLNNNRIKTVSRDKIVAGIHYNKDYILACKDGKILYNGSVLAKITKGTISQISVHKEGRVIFSVRNRLYMLRINSTGKLKQANMKLIYKFSDLKQITSISSDNDTIYIGSNKGLHLLIADGDEITNAVCIKNAPLNSYSLSNNYVKTILKDKEGIIWLGTYGGVNVIDKSHTWFSSLKNDPNNPNSLHDNVIFPLKGDTKGNIWFGTYNNGLSRYNKYENQFYTYKRNNSGLNDDFIKYFHCDSYGTTRILTSENIYCYKNGLIKRVKVCDKYGKELSLRSLSAIVEDDNGKVWLSLSKKIMVTNRVSEEKLIVEKEITFDKKRATIAVFKDSRGNLWFGGFEFLLYMNTDEDKEIMYSKKHISFLRANTIQVINEDSDGNIWLGATNGVLKIKQPTLQADSLSMVEITENDGLTSEYVTGILPDKDGVVWLSGWKGIMRCFFDSKNRVKILAYNSENGLVDEKFNRNAYYRDIVDNVFYFGGVNGVNFIESQSKPQFENVKVRVSDVLVNGRSIISAETKWGGGNNISIKTDEKIERIDINLYSSHHRSLYKGRFYYRISNVDSLWKFTRLPIISVNEIVGSNIKIEIKGEGEDSEIIYIEVFRSNNLMYVVFSLFMFVILMVLISVFRKRKISKYSSSELSENEVALVKSKLLEVMEVDRVYLNKELSVSELSEMIGISGAKLSQILNEHMNTNFYTFVNRYRVEEFKKQVRENYNENITLVALSEECGFSSKSSFYRAFKAETGVTPAQYVKSF